MTSRYGVASEGLARRAYQRVEAQTTSPGQILLRLYDGAIRFTRQAEQAIEAGDPAEKGKYLGKAMAIIDEFITALDHDAAPELCANLEALYLYFIHQLTVANTTMDAAPCREVIAHLRSLRETWEQVVKQTGG